MSKSANFFTEIKNARILNSTNKGDSRFSEPLELFLYWK